MIPGHDERRPLAGSGASSNSSSDSVALARATVDARQGQPGYATLPTDVQVAAIVSWLEPLPADRPWRTGMRGRHTTLVGDVAPAVVRTLQPPAGTRPQPVCPHACWITHAEDDLQEAG